MGLGPLLPTFTCKFEGKLWSSGGNTRPSLWGQVCMSTPTGDGWGQRAASFEGRDRAISGKTHLVKDGVYSSHKPWRWCMCSPVRLCMTLADCSPPDWTVSHVWQQELSSWKRRYRTAYRESHRPWKQWVDQCEEASITWNLEQSVKNKKGIWGNLEIPSLTTKWH